MQSSHYSCNILIKLELSQWIKKTEWWNFMKICAVVAELFRADLQTDNTKVTVTFHNFVQVPKNHCHAT